MQTLKQRVTDELAELREHASTTIDPDALVRASDFISELEQLATAIDSHLAQVSA